MLASVLILGAAAVAALVLTLVRSTIDNEVARHDAARSLAWAACVQAVHFAEEATTGFHERLPALLGLSGIPFTNVFNACATAASATQLCADTIRLGKYDIGIAVGMDKHPCGAFTDDPAKLALPQWYAQNGQFVTTKFFGMKANRYIHEHGISQATLAKVAAKNFRNGALNPNAFRRKPISEESPVSLRVTPRGRENGSGCLPTPIFAWVREPAEESGAGVRPGRVTHCCFEHAGQNFAYP